MRAPLPANESQRLAALAAYDILDTLPEAAYDDITLLASEICGAPIAAMSLIDSDRQWFKSAVGTDVTEAPRDLAFCAHAILETEVMVVPDARADVRFASNPLVANDPNIRFYAGAPLVNPEGAVLGTLCVIDHVQRELSEGQTRSLRALARQVMAQLELRRVFNEQEANRHELQEANIRLKLASITDDVTGFHNTRYLHQYLDARIERANPPVEQLSLVFFDMDGFKDVVDTHGHLSGARVLREVAEVVNEELEDEDRLVRYGGDEFVVILPDQDAERALAKTQRMQKAISEAKYLTAEGADVRVSASFGLAAYPSDAVDKKELLLAADQALFYSKATGKNRVSVGADRDSVSDTVGGPSTEPTSG
jgi:diguanylate cyclase (GGDEF)-like protein